MLIDPDVNKDDIDAAVAALMEENPKMSLKKASREVTESMGLVLADIPMTDEELEQYERLCSMFGYENGGVVR